jgi:glycosyltransferase involved in cell wall biosynthesis
MNNSPLLPQASSTDRIEVTLVMPCLNESRTLGACILEAREGLSRCATKTEIIVADNGSTDGSALIARELGGIVVPVSERGYGNALRSGLKQAQGHWVVMGDCDGSYDFRELPSFVNQLRLGFDFVIGNRFAGGIDPGAMPWSHHYIGNPILSWIGRVLFRSSIRDFHCGMRALRRDIIGSLNLRSEGMEFASEMVIRACQHGLRIAEIPIRLRRDGRFGPSHLRTWRDGFRHVRLMFALWLDQRIRRSR